MRVPLLALLVAACRPTISGPPLPVEPDDSGWPVPTDTGLEAIPDNPADPDPAAWIFSDEQVHRVEIELSDEAYASLEEAPKTYVEGAITFAGQRFDSVGIRLKGKVGSFRDLSGKSSFKIDMNRYVPGQELGGLEKLTFNNTLVDCSFTKERMAFRVFRALGLPAPRTGYVFVTVNGRDYGLYVNVESIDDEFLARNWEDPSGNLYEAEYVFNGHSWFMPDFADGPDEQFELEEGVDVGRADVYAVTAALDSWGGQPEFYEQLGLVVDWPNHMATMAAEQWAGQNDGYSLNENNFYAYFEPTTGLVQIVSWDMDYSFLHPSDWGFSWRAVDGRLSNLCLADAPCKAAYLELLDAACDSLDALDLQEELEATIELVDPWIARDPRRECDDSYVAYYQGYMRSWLASASDNARATWGL
jgi:hypothetical protein